MATYFPPLDRCMSGQEAVIPWTVAYAGLNDSSSTTSNTSLEGFFQDEETTKTLARPDRPFGSGDAQSKQSFETKVAPINVSQSANGDYDLQQIKEDALWLADNMGTEELSALRCAVVEWQARAADILLGRVPAAGSGQELQQSFMGRSTMKASVNGTAISGPDFKDEAMRRSRLVQMFLDEQSAARACSAILVSRGADDAQAMSTGAMSGTEGLAWVDSTARRVWQEIMTKEVDLEQSIEAIRDLTTRPSNTSHWPSPITNSAAMEIPYLDSLVGDLVSALRVLLARVYALDRPTKASDVQAWFKIMGDQSFYQNFLPLTATQNTFAPSLQCLVAVISAAILKLPQAFAAIERRSSADRVGNQVQYPDLGAEPYVADLNCLKEVNRLLFQAASGALPTAGPSVFAWSLLTADIQSRAQLDELQAQDDDYSDSDTTRRRPSALRSSTRPHTAMQKAWEAMQDFDFGEHRESAPQFMAEAALGSMSLLAVVEQLSTSLSRSFASELDDSTMIVSRLVLWDVLESGLQFLDYAGAIEASMALLHPHSPAQSVTAPPSPRLQAALYNSDRFRRYVLEIALARFPYELDPVLQLLISLADVDSGSSVEASLVVQILENLSTFLVMVPENFRAYALDNEDDGANTVYLTEDLATFEPKASLGWYQTQSESRALVLADGDTSSAVTTIPSGTPGTIVRDTRPFVFRLEHTYSGLAYLGVLLSTVLRNSELVVPAGFSGAIDKNSAALIVDLLTAILRPSSNRDEQDWVIGRFGSALRDELDIIAIVTEITEGELLAHIEREAEPGSHELLVACIHFFDTLAALSPERTWSWLSRSSLLGQTSGVSALVAVVSGAEAQAGLFPFLAACVKLYETVLDDAIYGVVKRRPKADITVGRRRFDSPMDLPEQTPERTISSVLGAFTRVAQDILITCNDTAFTVVEERLITVTTLCRSFQKLLRASYGIGTVKEDGSKLTDVLTLAATSQTVSDFDFAPLAAVLTMGTSVADGALTSGQQCAVGDQTVTVLVYLVTVLRTLKSRSGTAGSLPTQIIKLSGLLSTLYASHQSFRFPIAELMTDVLASAPQDNTDFPSILGQLSPDMLKSFLALLGQLDRPMKDAKTECKVWNFLTSVLESNQQYFAMYLLTGSLPKDRYKATEHTQTHKTLLRHALGQLSSIDKGIAPDRAIAVLGFVSKAQQVWIWATNEVRSTSDFLKNALAWMETLKPVARGGNPAESLIATKEYQIAALLCDILAVNLHASAEVGDKTLLKLLAPKMAFLSEHAAKVDGYNASLHANLAKNLPKWAACGPADFMRSAANPAALGEDYVYDLELAGRMLAHDAHWHGKQGFAEEFKRANVNLSLVEAQTRILRSWKTLATTLSECLDLEQSLQGVMATATIRALEANDETGLEVPNAAHLLQTRAELAFVVASRLVNAKVEVDQMRDLLPIAWSLVRSSPVNYDVASAPEDLRYYTTLLQVLYLAIQPHTYMDPKTLPHGVGSKTPLHPATSSALIEIVGQVVTRGFRALCGNLHSSIELAQPSDFALLTALLRAVLNVRGIKLLHPQLADQVSGSGLVRGALSLFSWSDRLAEQYTNHDPIYAELATTLLVALSSIPQVAEQMALEGVLSQLSSANLSNYFRKPGGRGPFDEPPRLFVIWSEGFLPLCLNLLSAVGPAIAAEIGAFLNSFPLQLKRAERSLLNSKPTPRDPRAGAVTLSLVSEARDLLLISKVLEAAANIGAAEGFVGSEVEPLEMDTTELTEDVANLTKNDRSLRDRITAMTEREVALQAQKGMGGFEDGLMAAIVGVLGSIGS